MEVTTEDGRKDEVVSRGRTYSVDTAAFVAEETGEAGKQLTPAYQRTTGVERPRGALPTPPPPIPPRPSMYHRISYPRHRRPGSTTPLSSPPPLFHGFTTLNGHGDRYSSRSSYSSSSTFSSTSSSSFGPRTPFTPLSELASLPHQTPYSPIPPIPIPPPKGEALLKRQQKLPPMVEAIPPFSWSSSSSNIVAAAKSKKLSPELSLPQPGHDSSSSSWLFNSSSSSAISDTDAMEGLGGELSARRLRRRDIGSGGHVRDRYVQDEKIRRQLTGLGGVEVH